MNHDSVRKLLSALVDGEIDDAGRSAVKEHLKDCPDCLKFEKTLRGVSSGIRGVAPFELREGFAQDVVRTIRRREEETRAWSPVELLARRLVLGLAAMVLIFVSLAMVAQQEEPVVVERFLSGEQVDSSTTRLLLAKETISKDDVLIAAVTR